MTFTQQDLGSAIRTIQLHSNRDRFTFEQLLPCELAKAVQTLTQEYAADPMTASLIFLGGLSGLLPLGSRVAHGHGYSVPLNLFLGVVARSGFSKTELMRRLVEWPAEGIRKRAREDFKRRRKEWFRSEVCTAKERKEEPGPEPLPLLPHLQNYSPEALSRYLEEYEAAGRGVLLFKDELCGLLLALDADAKRGRGNGQSQLLELFDGTGETAIRIGTPMRSYSSCHASVFGGIQPAKLLELVNGRDATGQFARFLLLRLPERPLELQDEDPSPAELEAKDRARGILTGFADEVYAHPPRTYSLGTEARRIYNHWFREKQEEAIDTADTVISSMLNKTGGQALRVAGLLHLARTRGMELVIPGQEMALATAMVDQLVHETRGLHQKGASKAHPFLRLINRMSWNRGNPKPVGWQDIRKRADQSQRDEFGAVGFGEAAQALASMDFGSVVQTPRGAWIYIASREMPA